MDRRGFLQAVAAGTVALGSGGLLAACKPDVPVDYGLGDPAFGPLGPVDANGLRLPDGFTSRIVATTGSPVADTGYVWHTNPDGGATFVTADGGWIYVSNCENNVDGGAAMLRFAPDGSITEARRILSGTRYNCAGGALGLARDPAVAEEIDRAQVTGSATSPASPRPWPDRRWVGSSTKPRPPTPGGRSCT